MKHSVFEMRHYNTIITLFLWFQFAVIVVLLIILQIIGGILMIVYRGEVMDQVNQLMNQYITEVEGNPNSPLVPTVVNFQRTVR